MGMIGKFMEYDCVVLAKSQHFGIYDLEHVGEMKMWLKIGCLRNFDLIGILFGYLGMSDIWWNMFGIFRILFGMSGYTFEHILNILEYFVGICFGHIKILLRTTIETIQIL